MSNSSPPGLTVSSSTLNHHISTSAPSWFCIAAHSKREHIAATWLQRELHLETYLPRVRFRRPQLNGPKWFIEALFQNYLFARFELTAWLSQVDSAPGVHRVVRFGTNYPAIPEEVIEALRARVGADQVHVIDDTLEPGQEVHIAGGPLHGLEAVVTRLMPGRQRLGVLLEFLGRQTMVELSTAVVRPMTDQRHRVLGVK